MKRTLLLIALAACLATDANARGGGNHGFTSKSSFHISNNMSGLAIAHLNAVRLGIPVAHTARTTSFNTRTRRIK
jgi:hypothetical protein